MYFITQDIVYGFRGDVTKIVTLIFNDLTKWIVTKNKNN